MEVTEKAMITAIVTARSRLQREECRRTKHDSAFSHWKVLIGPSNWEDYAIGKEGAERYRTQNLPNCTSCAGVYELGVAVWHSQTGRDTGKLDPDFIIPVYLGKSDNVRNRMQQYGREGAHLENGNTNSRFNYSNEILAPTEPGLFREIFSKGFSIAYRWAPMENTWDAEKIESDLLDKFDYAWNKGSNGERRRNDVLKKLKCISNRAPFLAKLHLFPQKRKGIKIKVYKSPSLENGLDFYSSLDTNGLLQRIFKFGRSQPRLVVRSGVDENNSSICGVALGHGVICKRPPIEGNKRCAEHKGMKVNGYTSKLLAAGKSTLVLDEHHCSEGFTPVCGVILDDGSYCTSKPLQRNKRCLDHKGIRICNSIPEKMKDKKENYMYGPILDYKNQEHASPSKVVKHFTENGDRSVVCGVDLDDGTLCTRQPPIGRKRCEEHKGMRIKETISISSKEEIPSVYEGSSRKEGPNHLSIPSVFCEKSSPTCGTVLQNGSFCSRKPSEGNKRCWQHESVRVVGSQGSSFVSDLKDRDHSSQYSSHGSFYENGERSVICGVDLDDGTLCTRQPPIGRKRCEEHKGMRIKETISISSKEEIPSVYEGSSRKEGPNHLSIPSVFCEKSSPTCGTVLQNGSFCSRKPSEGNKRCWQHKSMRVVGSHGSSFVSEPKDRDHSSQYSSHGSVYEHLSSTCGAALQNGSFCSRKPTEGNKRCWQHYGMRVNSSPGISNGRSYGYSSRYASYDSVYENSSSTCGAPCRNGSYCRRKVTSGRCWQHGG